MESIVEEVNAVVEEIAETNRDPLGDLFSLLDKKIAALTPPGHSPFGVGVQAGSSDDVEMWGLAYLNDSINEARPLSQAPVEVQIKALSTLPDLLRQFADIIEKASEEFWANPDNRDAYGLRTQNV